MSADEQFALTIIAFVGSVFSPYYAWSGRENPLNHCSVNVALYGKPGARWAMTERNQSALKRTPSALVIGKSELAWHDDALIIKLDEIGFPLPKAVRGSIRVEPSAYTKKAYALDPTGHHIWHPIAPKAKVTVDLSRPDLSWSGLGYLDCNTGSEPLEDGFKDWTWCRAHRPKDSLIIYETQLKGGGQSKLGLQIDSQGKITNIEAPPPAALPGTLWGISRYGHADPGAEASIRETFEDTPFYARSAVSTQMLGEHTDAMHESLSLERFRTPWLRALLPFRMPRRFF